MKILIGFGDSWAYGAGLDNPTTESYIALLAKKLNIPSHNRAVPATGVPHLIAQLRKFVAGNLYSPQNQYQSVFFISAVERDIMFDDLGQIREMHPQNPEFANYYKKIYTQDLAIFKLNSNLLALQQLCQYYNIDDRYVLGWQTPELWPEINLDKFYQRGTISICDVFLQHDPEAKQLGRNDLDYLKFWKPNPYMFPTDGKWQGQPGGGHPNQSGHEKIAQELFDWITG